MRWAVGLCAAPAHAALDADEFVEAAACVDAVYVAAGGTGWGAGGGGTGAAGAGSTGAAVPAHVAAGGLAVSISGGW